MCTSLLKPFIVACLVCISCNDSAYLVLGPLELTHENLSNETFGDGLATHNKSLPKREFRVSKEKQRTKSVSAKIEDDVEIVEQIPCCMNLFKSSFDNKQKNNIRSRQKPDSAQKNENTTTKVSTDSSKNIVKDDRNIIEKLKRQLAKEKEKVKNLTKELTIVKKLCDDSPLSYEDDDSEAISSTQNSVASIKTSMDLYNLINANSVDSKSKECPQIGASINDTNNRNFTREMPVNKDHINKDLFRDNVFQIPNFSVNDHKNYKSSGINDDLSVFNQNLMRYSSLPIPRTQPIFPYKDSNVHDDILKTLYPQFFLDDPSSLYDTLNSKRRSRLRGLLDPGQIYASNMKQLTAPYKIFPGKISPDFHYYNIRDRRDNVDGNVRKKTKNTKTTKKKNPINVRLKKNPATTAHQKFKNTSLGAPIESPIKLKTMTIKVHESADGDDVPKENYFEYSKDLEHPKKSSHYSKYFINYLNRTSKDMTKEDIFQEGFNRDDGPIDETDRETKTEEPTYLNFLETKSKSVASKHSFENQFETLKPLKEDLKKNKEKEENDEPLNYDSAFDTKDFEIDKNYMILGDNQTNINNMSNGFIKRIDSEDDSKTNPNGNIAKIVKSKVFNLPKGIKEIDLRENANEDDDDPLMEGNQSPNNGSKSDLENEDAEKDEIIDLDESSELDEQNDLSKGKKDFGKSKKSKDETEESPDEEATASFKNKKEFTVSIAKAKSLKRKAKEYNFKDAKKCTAKVQNKASEDSDDSDETSSESNDAEEECEENNDNNKREPKDKAVSEDEIKDNIDEYDDIDEKKRKKRTS